MTETQVHRSFTIKSDIKCPHCEYSLRGLRGPVATCPECGGTCDIAGMLSSRRMNWLHTVEYQKLSDAAIMLQFALVGIYVSFVLNAILSIPWAIALPCLAMFVWWIVRCMRAIRLFDHGEGVRLLFLSHLAYGMFTLSILLMTASAIGTMVLLAQALTGIGSLLGALVAVVIFIASVAGCAAAPKIDRAVGQCCIRRGLEREEEQAKTDDVVRVS